MTHPSFPIGSTVDIWVEGCPTHGANGYDSRCRSCSEGCRKVGRGVVVAHAVNRVGAVLHAVRTYRGNTIVELFHGELEAV